jgi:SPP1 gp7 family putative phage head morphogenesis protein
MEGVPGLSADATIAYTLVPLSPKEAIRFFKKKIILSSKEFYKLLEETKDKAFTVARVAKLDILHDLYDAVEQAIEGGETLADFKASLSEIMEKKGWGGVSPVHEEIIFRNNTQSAYMAGRYNRQVEQKKQFPYWEYEAVNDANVRATHYANDGKIYPADHPFWDSWYPPNGHRCRCGVRAIHKYEAQDEDLTIETGDPTGSTVEVKNPVTGKIEKVVLTPDEGWAHNPATTAKWEPDLTKYPEGLKKQYEEDKGRK